MIGFPLKIWLSKKTVNEVVFANQVVKVYLLKVITRLITLSVIRSEISPWDQSVEIGG